MPRLAASVETVPRSRIRELAEIAMSMEGVLRLYFGESSLPTPDYIKRAATRAMRGGLHLLHRKCRPALAAAGLAETIAGCRAWTWTRPAKSW